MSASDEQVRDSLLVLFRDADSRGMNDLAIAYGLSTIRMGTAIIQQKIQQLKSHQRKAS